MTALLYAVKKAHDLKVIKSLVEAGCDPNCVSSSGQNITSCLATTTPKDERYMSDMCIYFLSQGIEFEFVVKVLCENSNIKRQYIVEGLWQASLCVLKMIKSREQIKKAGKAIGWLPDGPFFEIAKY